MQKKTVYISADNQFFDTEEECRKHEENRELLEIIGNYTKYYSQAVELLERLKAQYQFVKLSEQIL